MDGTPLSSDRGTKERPEKLYVELTTECNLACPMCMRGSWDEPVGHMSEETFRRIIRQVGPWPGMHTIQLSGFGEPMVHPRFFELLALAKEAGYTVETVTNGLRLDRTAVERLIDLELDRLIVSVDGVDEEAAGLLHPGTWPAVREHLRVLSRRRIARGVDRPVVGLAFVATRRNVAQLPALVRQAPVVGFSQLLVTHLIPYTAELCEEILYERWSPAPRHRPTSPWVPLVELPLMDGHEAGRRVVEALRYSGAQVRIGEADLAGTGPRCRFVTEGRLAITWDGYVSPCLPLMHTHTYYFRGLPRRSFCCRFGNVNASALADIWDLPAYRAFRQRVRAFDFAPCLECGSCQLRETNREDCFGDEFPRCGECLWAAGLIQCP